MQGIFFNSFFSLGEAFEKQTWLSGRAFDHYLDLVGQAFEWACFRKFKPPGVCPGLDAEELITIDQHKSLKYRHLLRRAQ